MSEENVENVRRGMDAWNRGDLDEWLACLRPEGSCTPPAGSRIGASIGAYGAGAILDGNPG